MFPSNFVYEFFTLLVILDPIATVPVFLAVTYGLKWRDALKVALTALAVAFGILTIFIFLGLEFFKALDIPTSSFQLAGSFILFMLGQSMVTGKMHEEISKNVSHRLNYGTLGVSAGDAFNRRSGCDFDRGDAQ